MIWTRQWSRRSEAGHATEVFKSFEYLRASPSPSPLSILQLQQMRDSDAGYPDDGAAPRGTAA